MERCAFPGPKLPKAREARSKSSKLIVVLALLLEGCTHHPLDCAIGGGVGALHDDCLPGTAGYQESQARNKPILDLIALKEQEVKEKIGRGEITKVQGDLEIAEYKLRLNQQATQQDSKRRADEAAALLALSKMHQSYQPPPTYQTPSHQPMACISNATGNAVYTNCN